MSGGTSGGRARFKTGFGGFCYLELAGNGRWRALIVVELLGGDPWSALGNWEGAASDQKLVVVG